MLQKPMLLFLRKMPRDPDSMGPFQHYKGFYFSALNVGGGVSFVLSVLECRLPLTHLPLPVSPFTWSQ